MKIIFKRKETKLSDNYIKASDVVIIAKLTKSDFLDGNINHEYRIIRYEEIDPSSILFYGFEDKQKFFPTNHYESIRSFITREVNITLDEFEATLDLIDSHKELLTLPSKIDDVISDNLDSYFEYYFKGRTFDKKISGLNTSLASKISFKEKRRKLDKLKSDEISNYIDNLKSFLDILEEVEEIIKRKLYL